MVLERIKKLQAFLEKQPEDNFLRHALALEYIKIGNDEKAKALFQSVLEKDADYVGSYYHLGKLLERSGQRDEAAGVYQKGIIAAAKMKDFHAKNELQMALDALD